MFAEDADEVPEPGAFEVVSTTQPETSVSNLNDTLEMLRPFPKAGKETKSKRGRPPGKSAILTDSPQRTELREKETKRVAAQNKKTERARKRLTKGLVLSDKGTQKLAKKPPAKRQASARVPTPGSSSSEDEDFCIICMKTMPRKLTRENSVACIECKREVHLACANMGRSYFICQNCYSD